MRSEMIAVGFAGTLLLFMSGVGPSFAVRIALAAKKPAAARSFTPRASLDSARAYVEFTRTIERGDVDESPSTPAPPPLRFAAPPKAAAAPDPSALRAAVMQQLNTIAMCRRSGGPEGPGTAEITFVNDHSARVELSEPYENTAVGACIGRRIANAAPSFEGAPITITVRFEL